VLFNTVLFTGNANPALAREIATQLGVELGQALVGRFSDGEVRVEVQQNVRARDIFVIQPTCAPTNENLRELCMVVYALTRARTAARARRACRSAPRWWPTCCRPSASSGC
jgi:ribose-phosphate pyrophosphokinase